jgi:hypothetical protein
MPCQLKRRGTEANEERDPDRRRLSSRHHNAAPCTPPALSPATNTRPSRKQRLLHLLPTPPKSAQKICKYPGSVSQSTRRPVLTRTVPADANVNKKVQTPCDAPITFPTASARWKHHLRLSARCERERAGLPDSFRHSPAAAQPVLRARAHAMRTLRPRSRAV